METNWILITIVIVVAFSLVVFLIWQNQKDRKDLEKKIIEEEESTIPKEHNDQFDDSES